MIELTPLEVTPPSRHLASWLSASSRWGTRTPWDALSVSTGDDVLVLVAHPDDETVGVGAALADLVTRGIDVHVVAMTSGEQALGHLGRHPEGLAERRRLEFRSACSVLGTSTSRMLSFPDGRLADHESDLEAATLEVLARHTPVHVLTTWWEDPHPDHAALGRVARRTSRRTDVAVSGFPVWAMHWLEPDTFPKETPFTVFETLPRARRSRQDALACYPSQTQPLQADLQPVLPSDVVNCGLEIAVAG